MTRTPELDFPKITLGRVAAINGIEPDIWITGMTAATLTGLPQSRLHRWARAGLLSTRREQRGQMPQFLREELKLVSRLAGGDPPTLHLIRRYLRENTPEETP